MTIAISLKVHDGVVLAADSATTLVGQTPEGTTSVVNIYDNANKVFNLRKGVPIGAITWGTGSIGSASIATLMKDLRDRFTSDDDHWSISDTGTEMKRVAGLVREFIYEENYVPQFKDWDEKPSLGLIVAGYSAGSPLAEEYQIDIVGGDCAQPRMLRKPDDTGATWGGETEAVSRLMLGFGTQLPRVLVENLGVPQDKVGGITGALQQALSAPLVMPAMPILDAIELASFLVELTIKYSHFNIGAPTVGGPIEIAAITKHEGFKWVQRKHYFSAEFNPKDDG